MYLSAHTSGTFSYVPFENLRYLGHPLPFVSELQYSSTIPNFNTLPYGGSLAYSSKTSFRLKMIDNSSNDGNL